MMTKENKDLKKVLFRYYSDVLEEETVETMWAEIIDEEKGLYKLDNIPFYGPMIAAGDIFHALIDSDEEILVFDEVIEFSGNSVVQVILMDESFEIDILKSKLNEYGCELEVVNDRFFVVNIPAEISYLEVKNIFDEYENNEIIQYAEPVLSSQHQDDLNIS